MRIFRTTERWECKSREAEYERDTGPEEIRAFLVISSIPSAHTNWIAFIKTSRERGRCAMDSLTIQRDGDATFLYNPYIFLLRRGAAAEPYFSIVAGGTQQMSWLILIHKIQIIYEIRHAE